MIVCTCSSVDVVVTLCVCVALCRDVVVRLCVCVWLCVGMWLCVCDLYGDVTECVCGFVYVVVSRCGVICDWMCM